MASLLKVTIKSPKETIFNAEATSVSASNINGKFDILPQHANFLTLISNNPIIIRTTDRKNLTFKFPTAIIYAHSNVVSIYTGI